MSPEATQDVAISMTLAAIDANLHDCCLSRRANHQTSTVEIVAAATAPPVASQRARSTNISIPCRSVGIAR